jgi:hypothetical protein
LSLDEITKTENASCSPDLMEIIEKTPKKIIFGIYAFSFLVFTYFLSLTVETGVTAEGVAVMGQEGVQPGVVL